MARILRATHRGEITIGGRSLPCAVLEDGTRVLNQTEMFRALGRRGGAKRSGLEVGFKTPTFFDAKNLQPFIDEGLRLASKPIKFKPDAGAAYALGYKATLLPEICKVYLAARTAGQLHHSQLLIAEQCEVLVQGLATVGIIALVDEATGYQEDRARKALEKILEEFISDKLLAWAKTCPDDFYKHMFRLKRWPYSKVSGKKPGAVGMYTNDLVYARLAPEVLKELQKRNPRQPSGRRRHKHHQYLTEDIGHPRLREHLHAVVTLMKISDTWKSFMDRMDVALPVYGKTMGINFEAEE